MAPSCVSVFLFHLRLQGRKWPYRIAACLGGLCRPTAALVILVQYRQGHRHHQHFVDDVEGTNRLPVELPYFESRVVCRLRRVGRKQQMQLGRQRQLHRLQAPLADRINGGRYAALERRQTLLRIGEAESQVPCDRPVAPAWRNFIGIQRRQVRLDNSCEALEVTDFIIKINGLTASRKFSRRSAISQRIAHGARMIRTPRAAVKARSSEKTRAAGETG